MSDLITLAATQTYLGTTASTSGQIAQAITFASQMIESYCDTIFASGSYTEVYDGPGYATLILNHAPIISITSVTTDEDGLLPSGDYTFKSDPGFLYYKDTDDVLYVWPRGIANITVSYTAGYTTIPADLQGVCMMLTEDLLRNSGGSRGYKSETVGRYQYVRYDGYEMLAPYLVVLNLYRRIA